MDFKGLGKDVLAAAKPGLKAALKDVVTSVVIPKVYDHVLDWIKIKIPGVWDDMIIEGFRPKGKQVLAKLVADL